MDVVPHSTAAPRLLNTAVMSPGGATSRSDEKSRAKLQRSSVFAGNGRAIFIGISLGALVICAGGFLATNHRVGGEFAAVQKFFAVRTRAVTAPIRIASVKSMLVEISPAALRVTAISLGHPRIAIINGKEVTEGESITVERPNAGISVTLKVVKIGDGQIELTDGSRVLTTRILTRDDR